MKCALVQLNPRVGDITGNFENILAAVKKAASLGAYLCLCPELALIGYPPRDVLLYQGFIREAQEAAQRLAQETASLPVCVILGTVGTNSGPGRPLQNQILVLEEGKIADIYAKRLLPTYDVFDEARYFEAGTVPLVIARKGYKLALTICEDIWNDHNFWSRPLYVKDPLEDIGAFDILVNISASPYAAGKQATRQNLLSALSRKYNVQGLYVNQTGANDELIFDGRSFHTGSDGTILSRAKGFEEDLLIVDLENPGKNLAIDEFNFEPEVFRALSLGLHDYCHKNGLKKALLGLSGGIDSALTAVIAAGALGAENVEGLLLPSPWSSSGSIKDALALAENLGLARPRRLAIDGVMEAFDRVLAETFEGLPKDLTEENIQARIRGILLMAVSNKLGPMVLSTGNKSELAVGYSTIYGDMCGGLAVIGDLYKTGVYKVARWYNSQNGEVIPDSSLTKAPSAELRSDQTDQDSLPPYDELDAILYMLLEERKGLSEIVTKGYAGELVEKVARLVKNAEFKRRQGSPVLRVSNTAFGLGWRMPVTARTVFTG